MGGIRWDCGGGGNRAVVRRETAEAEGLGWVWLEAYEQELEILRHSC